jgi:hypothetical protein
MAMAMAMAFVRDDARRRWVGGWEGGIRTQLYPPRPMVKNVKAEMWDGKRCNQKRASERGGVVRTSWFAIKKGRMSDSKKIEEQAIYRTKENGWSVVWWWWWWWWW